jgi:hypothetical protein
VTDIRIIPCEECGGEGELYYAWANDPHPRSSGRCGACGGRGEVEIEVVPITMEDLDACPDHAQ